MIENKIKYSILIPTFNKCEYLTFTLQSILQNNYNNFEVIISDDHSTDGTDALLSKISDPRVKIIKPPIKLTQTKNYEYLIDFANGEWVTILGDDDGIMPNFFETLNNLTSKFQDIEVLKFKRAIYYWDNVSDLYGDRVIFFENLKRSAKIKNSKLHLFLSLCLLHSAQDLPMIYTSGVIKNSLIKRIKKKSNNFFFHSVVPDYYSMVALSFECKKYVFSETPIFWVGVSKKSTGRKRNIYFDKNKNDQSNEKIKINNNLALTGKISKLLHKLGVQSAYLFEAILKHPYKNSFWVNRFIRSLVLCSIICSYILILKKPNRAKIKLKKFIFLKIIKKEINKYNLSIIFISFTTILIYLAQSIIGIIKKISIFLEKKTKSLLFEDKPVILVSKNRDKFSNFVIVNDYLKNKND